MGQAPRLRPGTSPQALRIPPRGGHPALRSSFDSKPTWLLPWLSPSFPTSCPFRVSLISPPRPARNYPRFRIWRSLPERQWDSNAPDPGAARHTLCPLLTSAPRSRSLRNRSVRGFRTRRRPAEARPTAFTAHPPDLPPRPSMAMDFAVICPLVRPGRPRIRFLSIGSRPCSTLPSDPASRRRPCASLILRRHRAG